MVMYLVKTTADLHVGELYYYFTTPGSAVAV